MSKKDAEEYKSFLLQQIEELKHREGSPSMRDTYNNIIQIYQNTINRLDKEYILEVV